MVIIMPDAELNQRYFDAVSAGVFRGISSKAIGPSKQHDLRAITQGVFTKLLNARQLSGFKTKKGKLNFNAFTEVTTEKAAERIIEYIDGQIAGLTDTKRKFFEAMFAGPYQIAEDNHLLYDHCRHAGVSVTIPVREIPEGEAGGLSERLFSYAWNIFVRPGTAARWNELPGGGSAHNSLERWIDFQGKAISI